MRFVYDGTKIEDFFFVKILIEPLSKRYLPMCEEFFSKHNLEIKIIVSVYTEGFPAWIFFCFVKSG